MAARETHSVRPDRRSPRERKGKRLRYSVCLVTDSEEPSGVGEHMLALAAILSGYLRILLVCSSKSKARNYVQRATELGVETLALDWNSCHAADRFIRWLRYNKIDLCHVHAGIFWEGQGTVAMAKGCGVPLVIRTEHLPFVCTDQTEHARYIEIMRKVDKIVCVSNEVRDSFLRAGLSPKLVTVIRNGTPMRPLRSDRDQIRSSLGFGPGEKILLTVARYTEQKDYATLLDAVPTVLAWEPQARFIWVGTGPLEKAISEAVYQKHLNPNVRLLGERRDVPDLMLAADAFVLPSRFEGLPLVVLEAMAVGLPVVATRVCGTAEAVRHRVTGLLVEPAQSAAFASALIEVLMKPEWASQMGVRGRARAKQSFSADRMARETLALYNALWRERSGVGAAQRATRPDPV
jgi:glycosyltransferase involved in cell wall biosynthesis